MPLLSRPQIIPLYDDKTVGFGWRYSALTKPIWRNASSKSVREGAYRPEFINRIDEKVVFHSLTSDQMRMRLSRLWETAGSISEWHYSEIPCLACKWFGSDSRPDDPEMESALCAGPFRPRWKTTWQRSSWEEKGWMGKPSLKQVWLQLLTSRLTRRICRPLKRLTRITLSAAPLCGAETSLAFCPMSKRLVPFSFVGAIWRPEICLFGDGGHHVYLGFSSWGWAQWCLLRFWPSLASDSW